MSVEIVVSLPDDLAEEFGKRSEMEDRTAELQLLRLIKEYVGREAHVFRSAGSVSRVATILPVAGDG
jgi:metal-responsive CopG/Arc/MetJ family transcriptional regulator